MVIAQTRQQRDIVRQLYGITCPVVPNVWAVTDRPMGEKSSPPEVLWAGRYAPVKRPDWVLEVAKRLPGIAFRMAGGPVTEHKELFDSIQASARELPNVEILGFVPFAQMDRLYAQASAYLCSSVREGFPNTFLQAWDHRTPVVSTVDPDAVLTEHSIGIACHSVDELAVGIGRVCQSEEGRAMGERGRAYLKQVHSVDAVMSVLEPALHACGSKQRRSR